MNLFPYIEVSGSSYEMGYQHGAQAPSLVQNYLTWIEKLTSRSRDALASNAVAFRPYIEPLSPRFVDEVKGLPDAPGIPFEEALRGHGRAGAAPAWSRGG